MTVWSLSGDFKVLSVYKVDSSRRLLPIVHMRRDQPMSVEDARKFVDANYPNDGAVKAAADTLSLLEKRRTR
jgi:hypothetical protein